jgi:hypothetical protein
MAPLRCKDGFFVKQGYSVPDRGPARTTKPMARSADAVMNTILYIGHFEGVPGSTENSYAYAFRKHGWHVEQVEQVEAHRYGPDHVLRAAEACKPQLVLYTRTHNYTALDRRFTDVWRALEAKGIQTASVHLDVFHGIPEREQWIADGDPLFTTGTVFTADGRHTSERAFAEAGVNHVWLPPAIDERNLLPADFQFEPCEGLPPIVWVGSAPITPSGRGVPSSSTSSDASTTTVSSSTGRARRTGSCATTRR